MKEMMTQEFNTLSVIYHKPENQFVKSYEMMRAMRNKEWNEELKEKEESNFVQDVVDEIEEPTPVKNVEETNLIELPDVRIIL